jgi:homoserine O-acetyltransferase
VLVEAMNSHDVGRDRDGVAAALSRATGLGLVLGIDSDRLFPVPGQRVIAKHLPNSLSGADPIVISSPFGHDAFLIEDALVAPELARLLDA